MNATTNNDKMWPVDPNYAANGLLSIHTSLLLPHLWRTTGPTEPLAVLISSYQCLSISDRRQIATDLRQTPFAAEPPCQEAWSFLIAPPSTESMPSSPENRSSIKRRRRRGVLEPKHCTEPSSECGTGGEQNGYLLYFSNLQ